MRTRAQVGNVFSLASSYALVAGVSRLLDRTLPNREKYMWWVSPIQDNSSDSPRTIEPFNLTKLVQEEKLELTQLEEKILSNQIWEYFVLVRQWCNNLKGVVLGLVVLLCLISLPLNDIYRHRCNNKNDVVPDNDHPTDRESEDEVDESEELTPEVVEERVPETETSQDSPDDGVDIQESQVPKQDEVNDDELSEEEETFPPEDNLSLEDNDEDEVAEESQDDEPVYLEQFDTSINSATSSPMPIPGHSQTQSQSQSVHPNEFTNRLSLPLRPDLSTSWQNSASVSSSSSSYIQFSPSKSSQLNATVDTKNAYSQPFKFK